MPFVLAGRNCVDAAGVYDPDAPDAEAQRAALPLVHR